jgi:hypothetical protein
VADAVPDGNDAGSVQEAAVKEAAFTGKEGIRIIEEDEEVSQAPLSFEEAKERARNAPVAAGAASSKLRGF